MPPARWGGLAGGRVAMGRLFAGNERRLRAAPTISSTFRRGARSRRARLRPMASTIVYGAAWEAGPRVFARRVGNPESRPLGLTAADILGLLTDGRDGPLFWPARRSALRAGGTLAARAWPLIGAPREVLEDVVWADWSPDGEPASPSSAYVGGRYPARVAPSARPSTRPHGWISHPRVSPNGDLVAFLEHP